MNNDQRKKFYSMIIGGLIFCLSAYYIITYFQWQDILNILSHVNLYWLLGAGSCSIFIYWILRTMRWFILLKAVDVQINFFRLYLIGAISMAFSIVTPLQSGETIKIELLKKSGDLERLPGYAVFAVEKMLDLVVVGMMAAFCILMGLTRLSETENVLFISVAGLSFFVFFLMIMHKIQPVESSFLGRFFTPLTQCVKSRTTLAAITLLTIAGWLVIALGWYFSLCSIDVSLTLFQAITLTSITTMMNILSLIPGAIGVSEAGIAAILLYFGYQAPVGQAGALILRIYGLLVLLLGALHLTVMKVNLFKSTEQV